MFLKFLKIFPTCPYFIYYQLYRFWQQLNRIQNLDSDEIGCQTAEILILKDVQTYRPTIVNLSR